MKIKSRTLFIAVFLIIQVSAIKAQDEPSNQIETIKSDLHDIIFWYDTSGGLINNRILAVDSDEDLNLFMLVQGEDALGNKQARIVKMNQGGDIVYSHLLTAGGNYGSYINIFDLGSIHPLIDGGWKITGTSLNSSNTPSPYGESVDAEGNVNGFMFTAAFNAIYGGASLYISDSLVISGSTSLNSSGVNMWLKASTAEKHEKIHWTKKIQSEFNEYNVGLEVDDEGNIYVLAYHYIDAQFSYYKPILYKTDPKGEVLWRRSFIQELNPASLSMAIDESGVVYVVSAYGTESMMKSYSNVYTINSEGDSLNFNMIENIRASGILALSTGNLMLYGSNIKSSGTTSATSAIISKGKTIVINSDLLELNYDEMCEWDNPDYIMPSTMLVAPTSSDFLMAKELENGRIVCVGRVYMPEDIRPGFILIPKSSNRPLVVFTDPMGGFGNQVEKE